MLPSLKSIQERYARSCEFRQQIDKIGITKALMAWSESIPDMPTMSIVFPRTEGEINSIARGARSARGARAARSALDARAARGALDARAALDALDARSARSALDVYWLTWDIDWVCVRAIGAIELNDPLTFNIWVHLLEAFEAGAWYMLIAVDKIAVIPIPEITLTDGRNRLHCDNGPALQWLDATLYYWNGVLVNQQIIKSPETITVAQIEQERNAEVRRIMIDRRGMEWFLVNSNSKEINRDNFGVLYQKELKGDEPLVMVRVTNATPEPESAWEFDTAHPPSDPVYKDYFIRVPPHIRTAHEAVAWTFDMEPEMYHPRFES